MRRLSLFLCVLTLVFTASAITAIAQGTRDQLNGTYSFTGEQACLVSPLGFNPNLTPVANSPTSVQSASTNGTMIFNADGTGTAQFRELLLIQPPAASPSANAQQASFTFDYSISPDGVLEVVFGSVTGSFVAGPFTGLTFANNPPPMFGRVARNGSAITLTTINPAVEVSVLGPPANLSIPRICHRSRVLVPIHVSATE